MMVMRFFIFRMGRKMAKKTVRGTFHRFFDVGSWLGMNEIRRNTGNLRELIRDLFTVSKPERRETFDEAIARYNLSEKDLEERMHKFFTTSMLYLGAFFCILLYSVYLFTQALYRPMIMSLAFSCVLFSMFFKEHFWYTQMKYRRLGFTFFQWLCSIFK